MQHQLVLDATLPKESIPRVRGVAVKNTSGGITFTAVRGEDMQRLKRLLAFSLADIITHDYERKSLSAFIDASHPHFLPAERQEVLRSASLAVGKIPPDKRTHYIEDRLYAFLTETDRLSLEGFVRFRLKEYRSLLKSAAQSAVDVFLAEKEYAEFITLLKLFIASQPKREAMVQVLAKPDGAFLLFDHRGTPLAETYQTLFEEAEYGTLEKEERLFSTLITLAPEEITFHAVQNLQNVHLLETVMRVFPGRVHICESCPICKL